MKNTRERGITIISLAIALILLLIITGAIIGITLDGLDSVDKTQKAGEYTEKTSLLEVLQGEIENIRTQKLIKGQTISEEDIENVMKDLAEKYSELTYNNSKITSTKRFEITKEEVKERCQI